MRIQWNDQLVITGSRPVTRTYRSLDGSVTEEAGDQFTFLYVDWRTFKFQLCVQSLAAVDFCDVLAEGSFTPQGVVGRGDLKLPPWSIDATGDLFVDGMNRRVRFSQRWGQNSIQSIAAA